MPYRLVAATALAAFLRAIAHPRRVQIIEELRNGEADVASLASSTGLTHSKVSQHLMVLRAQHVVIERREGRRVIYRLSTSELASWLVSGLDFLNSTEEHQKSVRAAVRKAKTLWSESNSTCPHPEP